MNKNIIVNPILEWPNVESVMNRFYQQQCIKSANEFGILIDPDDYLYGIERAIPEQHISQIKDLIIQELSNYIVPDEIIQLLDHYEGRIASSINRHMDLSFKEDIASRIVELLDVEHDVYQEFHGKEK